MAKKEVINNATPPATALEELYQKMVELAPDGIVTTDAKGVITSCNTAITRMVGYSRDELLGKHFSKMRIFRLKDVPKYLNLFQDILGGKVGESIEVAVNRKDKMLITVDVRVSLLKIGGKTVIQANMRDVTERRRMEKERQR